MRVLCLMGLIGLLSAGVAAARDQQSSAAAHAQPAEAPLAYSVELDKLPISVDRIQKRLATSPGSKQQIGLKLEYYIEVYGKAPPLDLFANFDVRSGPVPFSAPTHQDFLDVVTPQGFRTPPVDLGALVAWLSQRLGKKPR